MANTRVAALVLAAAFCMTLPACGSGAGGADPEQPRADSDELEERYADLEREVDVGAREMEARLTELRAPDGDGPAEQLSRALGPKDPRATEDDLFDDVCSDRGVSCEVLDLEQLLAADREDFSDYGSDSCDVVTERAYYEGPVLADTEDGANYLKKRGDIEAAAEGIGADADALVGKAQRMEEAERAWEEASGFEAGSERTLAEVEELAAFATEEGARADEALAVADERWAGYEERAGEVRQEALAFHDRLGC